MKRIIRLFPETRSGLFQSVFLLITLIFLLTPFTLAQRSEIKWSSDGNSYFRIVNSEVVKYTLPENKPAIIITKKELTPEGNIEPLRVAWFDLHESAGQMLIYTNTIKVWRLNTRGDYWTLDMKSGKLNKLGKNLPPSSLMFAKFSPDGRYAAYVSGNNIYVEELATSIVKPLTTDGTITLINGTFDWAYEEEFYSRDGFRWSPDSKSIAYWQIDAGNIRKFYMINNTDSIYSRIIPLEYPVAGEKPSSAKIGVVSIENGKTVWMNIPGDPFQNYLVRTEFIPTTGNLLVQQLNRKQNTSKLYVCNAANGDTKLIQQESDEAWVDLNEGKNPYGLYYKNEFIWMNETSILWTSEKDGWRHLYQVPLAGGAEKLVTNGKYDVISFEYFDKKSGYVYFMASPENATRQFLYRTSLKAPDKIEMVSPSSLQGTHGYSISPNGKYAYHTFSNYCTRPSSEFLQMAGQKPLGIKKSIIAMQDSLKVESTLEFFKVTTSEGVEMDGWMSKPKDFDASKKYPVLFYVYSEPASATVTDTYGAGYDRLYAGDLAEDGYIYISLDNRGTPAPKGREWRKSIYRNIGQVNIRDQAMAAKEILKWGFVDPERVAVWGWSGGGSATLNLLLQYPDIYKTGISIAAVDNLLTYDNIYQERYMGLPQETRQDYINGSAITYAKNLKGNLLLIHGTGDDNVHYQNAEMMINELVKYNKQFQFMAYPNRTHGISEGAGTTAHLVNLYTSFLRKYCPPGPR